MSKKQTELTIARHWEMLQMLPSRRPGITTAELELRLNSSGYEINRRTIQRDLVTLSRLFPLECNDKSKPFGWYWMPNNRIELPGFSVPEALSLQLIEDYMKLMLPVSILAVLEPQFKQARLKLNAIKSGNKQASWLDKVRVVSPTMPQIAPKINQEVLEQIQDALINDRQLEVEYLKPQSSEINNWVLHPLGLIQRGVVSYLVCTMFGYTDIRLCALHRIKNAEMLKALVNRPKDFCLDNYIDGGSLQFGSGKAIKFEATVHSLLLEFLEESPLSEDMKTSTKNDIHTIKATVVDSWQLFWWIQSQGSLIEVVKPVALRKKIIRELEKTISTYS